MEAELHFWLVCYIVGLLVGGYLGYVFPRGNE
jgi:hypothetical protein